MELIKKIAYYSSVLNLSHNHTLLMSYPKSGNTWLKFLIASYISGSKHNFHSIESVIPEIGTHWVSTKHLILKTHKPNNLLFNKSQKILLTRNPVDTLVSYYNFELQKKHSSAKDLSFKEFILSREFGMPRLNAYYNSFKNSNNTLIIDYSDLKNNCEAVLITVIEFLKLKVELDKIKNAIKFSSLESMLDAEINHGMLKKDKISPDFRFVGSKNKISRSELITPEIESLIINNSNYNDIKAL